MFFFKWFRRNAGDGYNGDHGEEPADSERMSLLEQGRLSTGENLGPREIDGDQVLTRDWAMGRGVIQDAQDFNHLLSMDPETVIRTRPGGITALLEETAEYVGTVESTDTTVNAAFGHRHMLTKGSDEAVSGDYEALWTRILNERANRSDPKRLGGWKESATLKMYRLSIKDAAAPLRHGILTPLLRREENGVPTDRIWEFLSVQAIVQHKWDHWAAKWLLLESICFLIWLFSFVCFLLVYISADLRENYDTMDPNERGAASVAYIADASSVVFMSPFIVKAFNGVVYYGWERFQMWSVIDACCYVFQLLISFFHYFHFYFDGKFYTTLLAVHCIILFVRIQYYCRVIEVGAAYVESLKILMTAVHGLLFFIVLTAISAALSFATLYKWDIHKSNVDLEGFSSLPRTIITTFSVLLGNFEPSYVFGAENRYVKGIFFVIFEGIITIAVLNLMIAVMTQSYSWILSRGLALHNRCRAETIDRLEVTLPRCFYHKYEPYIHFLVREEVERVGTVFTHRGLSASTVPMLELKRQVEHFKRQVEDLKEAIKELRESINNPSNRVDKSADPSSSSVQN